ncbi:D-alanine--D-alanine ligase family protein [Cellulosilyticum lentocellum]|uniref:D-alanine--D-alanine ligase n=1 Tax=Cellulosilyticum lentocellum (strain ATCC 49066 / DSM 5427 / NCIMB 11756 / RHM5) TaxID=642492 RepID=F2JIN9_CELLD|nr:D-alanine--D-alanine ligase family protein [Cellulosilyticum lentocellum]ADZ85509.1 D-alanine/D-alanine ligase [Cellulosilyticum lentocellum DSM 5427]
MKKSVLLLFGGCSSEHEVSLKSATTILNNIDRSIYEVHPVGITKEGKWLLYTGTNNDLSNNEWQKSGISAFLSPDATQKALWIFKGEGQESIKINIDIVFPVLHGKNGEDGTIQGLCQLAQIPFVGCGVLASAVSMDKAFTKIAVATKNVPQARFVLVKEPELKHMEETIKKIESAFSYPYFIKPANAGSSVGISKANNKEELISGLYEAVKHDRKVLIEETIIGREVETAVMGNDEIVVSGVGEILAAAEFYDFDAKYNNAESKTVVDADLPNEIKEKIRGYAKDVFDAVEGKGLSRVDFFVKENGEIIFNEINTLPGFTSISMYPMLFAATGLSVKEIITKLLELASL